MSHAILRFLAYRAILLARWLDWNQLPSSALAQKPMSLDERGGSCENRVVNLKG